jgi:hypothetical protein
MNTYDPLQRDRTGTLTGKEAVEIQAVTTDMSGALMLHSILIGVMSNDSVTVDYELHWSGENVCF